MTEQYQQFCLVATKLYLPKARLVKHYLDCFIFTGLTLFFLLMILKAVVGQRGQHYSPFLLLFLIFPIVTVLIYLNKRQELRLREIETMLAKRDNYQVVKDTLKTLCWNVKVDNKGFIEAYANNFGFWTWTNQMISILIDDNRILFNSIGNVDTYATQPFSWGQNSRNIKQFRETLDLILTGYK